MPPPPRPSLKSIFSAAIDHPPGAERAAHIDQVCAGDPELLRHVELLLKAYDEAGDFLASSPGPIEAPWTGAGDDHAEAFLVEAADSGRDSTADDLIHRPILIEGPGTIVGRYKLLQKIGEGGMGSVFMAEQEKPIRRKVALKVIKPGMDTAQVIARFEAERQALAMMDHPNIARVLDVGATATGRPFFVMELVRGVPITDYCDKNQLTPAERLALFIPVCQAIQHAHQKGIIHRDIKPSNVLVTLRDGHPEAKVIDFGVAKAIEQRLTERTMFTEFGAIIGTLEYMSPEQAEMGALDIDTRSDIYSLGVVLYELLTGSTPLRRSTIRDAAYSEILRLICEREPSKPSTRLSDSKDALPSISAQRRMEPARLSKLVRGDLDWIVMKSLAKDRTRRYDTATGFARDIQRYLDGDPIEARPPSATYRLTRFARKHRAALVTASVFVVVLVAATAVSLGLAVWADIQRVRAIRAEAAAKDGEQLAIDAAERYSDVIRATSELKANPHLLALRRQLLREPQAFFRDLIDRLQANQDATPASLARLAHACFILGLLTDEVGDKDEALRPFEQSQLLWERLARIDPANARYRAELARVEYQLGHFQIDQGQTVAALQLFDHARQLQERLAVEHPEVEDYRSSLGRTCHAIGYQRKALGDKAKALQAYEEARPIWERLNHDHPQETRFQGDLTWCLDQIAQLRGDPQGSAVVLAAYLAVRPLRERLARENPDAIWYQLDLASNHVNLATSQENAGQIREALATLEQIRPTWEHLIQLDPSHPRYQLDLARTIEHIGTLRSNLGRPDDALKAYKEALDCCERVIAEHPAMPEAVVALARSLRFLAQIDAQHEDFPGALVKLRRGSDQLKQVLVANPGHLEAQKCLSEQEEALRELNRQKAQDESRSVVHPDTEP